MDLKQRKNCCRGKYNGIFDFTELICLTSAPVQQSLRELQRKRQSGTEN